MVGRAAAGRALHLALVAASARFALSAILVLGLGLGASTALFAALDRVLFRPLPYADPDRLVSVGLLDAAPARFLEQTEAMIDKGYVQVWDTTASAVRSR